MTKRSSIWAYSILELQTMIDSSSSLTELCGKLNINVKNGSVRTLYRRIQLDNLSTGNLLKNKSNQQRASVKELEFCKKSKTSRKAIKKYLIQNKIVEYICCSCGLNDTWNGKILVLQLEHLNGINDDNTIENLAFICPNCHTQTSTYAGKNSKKKLFYNEFIYNKETDDAKTIRIKNSRKFDPSIEELQNMLNEKIPFTTIGKIFGVSDNAIRKRCRLYGIL